VIASDRLDEIKARLDKATPGPWGYNSYRAVFGPPALIQAYDDAPDYPEGPRPTIGTPEDMAWCAQRAAAYEAEPIVASVPAHYGDTATGRHAADAEFIAHAREDVPYLLALLAERDARIAHLIAERDHDADTLRRVYGHKTHLESQLGAARDTIEELTLERGALRATLEWYADIRQYNPVAGDPPDGHRTILSDRGARARAALAVWEGAT
jgi:hypothetical protein